MFLIYKTTNLTTGKIYIGCHITDNQNDGYIGSGTLLKRAIAKYGVEDFVSEIIEECDTVDSMLSREREIVNEVFVQNDDTYNLTIGGGSFWHINKTGKNLYGRNAENLAKLGRLGTDTHNRLLSESDEYRERYSKAVSEGLARAYANGHKPSFLGKQHTEHTKRLIGDQNALKQSGSRNSQYGTCWIKKSDTCETRKVKREELPNWLAQGWERGRFR